jgi:hypothetical protein
MCIGTVGITTFGALIAQGVSRRRIDRRIADGELVRLRTNVYAGAGACVAVTTAARHGGAIACVTAARHLGLWTLSGAGEVHVWLGGHGRRREHPDCSCVDHWDDLGIRDAFGAPSAPRVLRQIAGCRGIEEFFVCLESALHLGLITPEGLGWLRAHCGGDVRDAIDFARSDAESGLESLLRWRMRWLGIELGSQVDPVGRQGGFSPR